MWCGVLTQLLVVMVWGCGVLCCGAAATGGTGGGGVLTQLLVLGVVVLLLEVVVVRHLGGPGNDRARAGDGN